MKTLNKIKIGVATCLALLGLAGCFGEDAVVKSRLSSSSGPQAIARAAVAYLTVYSGNTKIYDVQAASNGRLELSQNDSFNFCFGANSSTGAMVSMSIDGNSFVSGQPATSCYQYVVPNNMSIGTHDLNIVVTAPGMATGNYDFDLDIACNSAMTASLQASQFVSGVSASLAGGAQENWYSYSASGPNTAGALCAWDFNGDGLLDNAATPCSQSHTQYSNYVGNRGIRLKIIDTACNYDVTKNALFSANVNLPARSNAALMSAGINFIAGDVSSVGAYPAPRNTMLNHRSVATNPAGQIRVRCSHDPVTGSFVIDGPNLYAGKADHGFRIETTGFPGAPPVAGTIGSFLAARFKTDRAIDTVQNQIRFDGLASAGKCTGTAVVQSAGPGTPCQAGQSTPGNLNYRAQISGTFSCNNVAGDDGISAINVANGAFLCIFDTGDSCTGGGGGGGGQPPMNW